MWKKIFFNNFLIGMQEYLYVQIWKCFFHLFVIMECNVERNAICTNLTRLNTQYNLIKKKNTAHYKKMSMKMLPPCLWNLTFSLQTDYNLHTEFFCGMKDQC